MRAGLLTDSLSETFPMPMASVVQSEIRKVWHGASQQRDCSGLSPDSLFIRYPCTWVGGTLSRTKVVVFFEYAHSLAKNLLGSPRLFHLKQPL